MNLYSVPAMPLESRFDLFLESVGQHRPDVIFLQFDPMHYLTRQRYMAHKCALHEYETITNCM